jgi:RHS repeat-associated protein
MCSCGYSDVKRRVRRTDSDGSFWLYEYDSLGQLLSGKHYWSDGTPVAGQQFEYAFDHIGNRTSTREGGDPNGTGLRSAAYSANSLNQYTQRDVPGAADIMGIAHAGAAVAVNLCSGAYRKGEYFWHPISVNNTSAPVWQEVSVVAALTGTNQTNAGHLFVPRTPEVFAHDADGNLTNDGRFAYTWDAENRLLQVESYGSAPTASKRRVSYTYDAQSRLVRRTVEDGSSGSYVVASDQKYVWNDWLCLADLNATNNTLECSYLWGLDLSGSMQGAGGIGGLLAISDVQSGITSFPTYDGNGNVTALVSASDGSAAARYEYDPFGRTVRATGPMARANPMRFSTKRFDDTADLVYYGYRHYNPLSGCWPSRDPIYELHPPPKKRAPSFLGNLCSFVSSDPVNAVDPDGLAEADEEEPPRDENIRGLSLPTGQSLEFHFCSQAQIQEITANYNTFCGKGLVLECTVTSCPHCCLSKIKNVIGNADRALVQYCTGKEWPMRIDCMPDNLNKCGEDQTTCAYTYSKGAKGSRIYFCDRYFTDSRCANRSSGCTVWHEILHLIGFEDDVAKLMDPALECLGCPKSGH